MFDFSQPVTPELITAISIVVSNVIMWYFSPYMEWTPRKKGLLGAAVAFFVFAALAYSLAPGEWSNDPAILINAVFAVLAAAGAPVMKETFINSGADAPMLAGAADVENDGGVKRQWRIWTR